MKFTNLLLGATALFSAVYADSTNDAPQATITGSYDNGVLHWIVKTPIGSSDTAVDFEQTTDSSANYVFQSQANGGVYNNDQLLDPAKYIIDYNPNLLIVPTSDIKGDLTYKYDDAAPSGDGPWTLIVDVEHYDSDGGYTTSEVKFTISKPEPSKSSQSPSSSSSVQSSSSPVASSSSPVVSSSSSVPSSSSLATTSSFSTTETSHEIATTVVTITSCSDNICTKKPVTTAVTVCTATENGVKTVYTTYCPLSTSAAQPVTSKATLPATTTSPTTISSVSQSQSYTPPAVFTATGMAAAVEVQGATLGAVLIAFAALM